MKMRRLALILLILLCIPCHALAAFTAMDGEGEALGPGAYVAPGAELHFTCALPGDLGTAPALRLQLQGMTLEELTFQPGGEAGEEPEIIYGSDGCILLFTGAVGDGAAIAFRATAQGEPGEARASLLKEGETLMEISHPVGFAPTPSPTSAPVSAPAEPETEAPSSSWIFAVVILGVLSLGAVGYWIVWPKVREGRGKD